MNETFRVFHSLDEAAGFGPCALSIGNFDGVHKGHRSILRRVVEVARQNGWKAAVMTFDPHPTHVVAPDRAPKLMTTPEQRCAILRGLGIEEVLILPFTPELARLSPEEFVAGILVEKLRVRAVLVGENFRFGYQHAGDTRLLAELGARNGFRTEIVPSANERRRVISSSAARRLISEGDITRASRMLDGPYGLEGEVIPGRGVGLKQTVPTLNLATQAELLPAVGVYITRTIDRDDGRLWPSVTNVGYRPTFGGGGLSIETHLLAPLDGPTPKRIRVEFLRRLRAERKFESAEALKAQILTDAATAQAWFRRGRRWIAACQV